MVRVRPSTEEHLQYIQENCKHIVEDLRRMGKPYRFLHEANASRMLGNTYILVLLRRLELECNMPRVARGAVIRLLSQFIPTDGRIAYNYYLAKLNNMSRYIKPRLLDETTDTAGTYYSLTEYGRAIADVLLAIAGWHRCMGSQGSGGSTTGTTSRTSSL